MSGESSVEHQFFIKAHNILESVDSEPATTKNSITIRKKPIGRTILVYNVPSFLSSANLRHMFSPFGRVVDALIQPKPSAAVPEYDRFFPQDKSVVRGFGVAYVVFQNPKSMKEILNVNTEEVGCLIMGKTRTGLRKYIDSYNAKVVETHILEDSVKKFMSGYEKEEIRRKEAEKQAGEADEDGWVKVTKLGKRSLAGTARTETVQEKLKAKKRRMEKVVLNLTPTQIKETKARQLEELKKKFEEDKQKVALLKQQRKFKPF